jgi:hypothetical protein
VAGTRSLPEEVTVIEGVGGDLFVVASMPAELR